MFLLLLVIAGSGFGLPAKEKESEDGEGELSRKILGSSVVTSVSVIMDTGNGSQAIFSDAVGKPVSKPPTSNQLASPINLLNPDRYEFYTFDDNGGLVKRLMTLNEIQSIIASGDGESLNYNSKPPSEEMPEKKVADVVNNVQNVLKEEIESHKNSNSQVPLDTPDVSASWSMILPAIFGNSGENIQPPKSPNVPTPDTITIDSTTLNPTFNDISTFKHDYFTKIVSSQKPSSLLTTEKLSAFTKTNPTTLRLPESTVTAIETREDVSSTVGLSSSDRTEAPLILLQIVSDTNKSNTNETVLKEGPSNNKTEIITKEETNSNVLKTDQTLSDVADLATESMFKTVYPLNSIPSAFNEINSKRPSVIKRKPPSTATKIPVPTIVKEQNGQQVNTASSIADSFYSTQILTSSAPSSLSTLKLISSSDTTPLFTPTKPQYSSSPSIPQSPVTHTISSSTSSNIPQTTETTYYSNISPVSYSTALSSSTTNAVKTENTIANENTVQTSKLPELLSTWYTQTQTVSNNDLDTATNSYTLLTTSELRTTTTESPLPGKTTVDTAEPQQTTTEQDEFLASSTTLRDISNDATETVFIKVSDPAQNSEADNEEKINVTKLLNQLLQTTNIYEINTELSRTTPSITTTIPEETHFTQTTPELTTEESTTSSLKDSIDQLIQQTVNNVEQPIENLREAEKISEVIGNSSSKPMVEFNSEAATAASVLVAKPDETSAQDNSFNDAISTLMSQVINQVPSHTTIENVPITTEKENAISRNSIRTTLIDENLSTTEDYRFDQVELITMSTVPNKYSPASIADIYSKHSGSQISSEQSSTTELNTDETAYQSTLFNQPTTTVVQEEQNTSTTPQYQGSTQLLETSESVKTNYKNEIENSTPTPAFTKLTTLSVTTETGRTEIPQANTHATESATTTRQLQEATSTEVGDQYSTTIRGSTEELGNTELISTSLNRITTAQDVADINLLTSTNPSLELDSATNTDTTDENITQKDLQENNYDSQTTWSLISTAGAPQQITTITPNTEYPEVTSVELVPKPVGGFGLEDTTASLDTDIYKFSELCNELAFSFWNSVTSGISFARSVVVSPFAATSMLAMVFLGARGSTSGEMNEILKLDDMVTFNPHSIFKGVAETIEVSKKSGVAASVMVKELYSDKSKGRVLPFYKERVKQFYDAHVEEASFREIGDVIRRRTNLLVKRQTWGKIPEYLRDSTLTVRPPLAAVSANVFQTDCSESSTDGRDGELHFVVLPSIRQRKLIPIPAVVWRSGFLAGYDPGLDATAVSIGTKEQTISTIFVIPGQQGISAPGDGLVRLEARLIESAFRQGAWSRLLRSLIPRPGLEVQIPRFSHRSIINATAALQRMGLKDLFNAQRADLKGLNGIAHELYLSDMIQINTFATCGEGRIDETHHSEIYPATANRSFRRIRKIQHGAIADKTATDNSDILDEPRDYQRSFHDPLYDPSYLELPLQLRPRQARLPENPRLRFDRPFLYFVRHNPTGLILHMGRFNPRLLP